MEQKGDITTRKYEIGASKIKFSSYVRKLQKELQKKYNRVKMYKGRKRKQKNLKIYSNSSNFSLIILEEDTNRDNTIITINFSRVPNKKLKGLEDKVDETFMRIFGKNLRKNEV